MDNTMTVEARQLMRKNRERLVHQARIRLTAALWDLDKVNQEVKNARQDLEVAERRLDLFISVESLAKPDGERQDDATGEEAKS